MADYSRAKATQGSVFPDRAVDAQDWKRVEPLLTPDQLRMRFLFGIPLYSFIPDPVTGERAEITNDLLKDFIERSVSEVELATNLTIFPVQFNERHPYDRNFWQSFGYIRMEHRPIISVDTFAFTPATGNDIFQVNPDWIDNANFHKGQINLIPFVPAVAANFVQSSGGGTASGFAYLQVIQGLTWIPALVKVLFTAGFPNGEIPKVVNELIGATAAIEVLGMLQSTNRANSYSVGMDGGSQSISTPGPQVYQPRIEALMEKQKALINKIRNIYGFSIITSYV